MLLALGFGVLSVIWERLMFVGLFDFSSTYRISGLFSGMLVGGASFDGFLVLTFPFFVCCFYGYRGRLAYSLGLLLFTTSLYTFLITFTRTNYLALMVIFLVLYIGHKKTTMQSPGQNNTFLLLILITCILTTFIIGGGFIQKRFYSTETDLKHRVSHWSKATQMVESSSTSILLGMGKGTFPAQYFYLKNKESSMAGFQVIENNGLHFLRFSPSDKSGNLFIRQRIPLSVNEKYQVSVTLRSFAKNTDKLLIEFCERSIFPNQPECLWEGFLIPRDKSGQWVTIHKIFETEHISKQVSHLFKPFEVSLLNRGLKSELDIAKVEITTTNSQQIIKNSEFNKNFDHWFFYSGNHSAWHTDNQWIALLFEGGIFELLFFCLFLFSLLWKLYKQGFTHSYNNTILLASLSGFITIGFFGSPLDDPRITWLFYLISWLIIVQTGNNTQDNPGIKYHL